METTLDISNCNNLDKQNFPENMQVRGTVYLKDSSDIYLPKNLKISGDLKIISKYGLRKIVKDLPENLVVKGDLILEGTHIRTIQSGTRIKGSIMAYWSGLTNILSNVKIGGVLDLQKCDDIDNISDDIEIKGESHWGDIVKIKVSHYNNIKGKQMWDIIPHKFNGYVKIFF